MFNPHLWNSDRKIHAIGAVFIGSIFVEMLFLYLLRFLWALYTIGLGYTNIYTQLYIWHILIPFCNTYNSVFPNIHFPTIEKKTLSKLQKEVSNNENIRRTFLVEVLHCLRQVGYGICFTGNGLVEMFLFRGWPTDVLGWEKNIETYGEGRYVGISDGNYWNYLFAAFFFCCVACCYLTTEVNGDFNSKIDCLDFAPRFWHVDNVWNPLFIRNSCCRFYIQLFVCDISDSSPSNHSKIVSAHSWNKPQPLYISLPTDKKRPGIAFCICRLGYSTG